MATNDPIPAFLQPPTNQTPEQLRAIESQQREGFFARVEGRFLQFRSDLHERETQATVEKGRVDALEQKVKGLETGHVQKTAEMLSARENNLVLLYPELLARVDHLQKTFEALVSQINGQAPGFFIAPPLPVPAPKGVPAQVPPPPGRVVPIPDPLARGRVESQERLRAQEAERQARTQSSPGISTPVGKTQGQVDAEQQQRRAAAPATGPTRENSPGQQPRATENTPVPRPEADEVGS